MIYVNNAELEKIFGSSSNITFSTVQVEMFLGISPRRRMVYQIHAQVKQTTFLLPVKVERDVSFWRYGVRCFISIFRHPIHNILFEVCVHWLRIGVFSP